MPRLKNIPVGKRICAHCGNNTTYKTPRGKEDWFDIEGKPWCKSCYFKVFEYPKKKVKWGSIHSHRRVGFKGSSKSVKENPRIGFCNICKKWVGEEYINRFGQKTPITKTDMHHINYHEDNPLKDTLELCSSCHAKISKKQIEIILL